MTDTNLEAYVNRDSEASDRFTIRKAVLVTGCACVLAWGLIALAIAGVT
jgi:hypothetical protein